MCGCNKVKEVVTSAQLEASAETIVAADVPTTQAMRERRETELTSVRAAIANSRG